MPHSFPARCPVLRRGSPFLPICANGPTITVISGVRSAETSTGSQSRSSDRCRLRCWAPSRNSFRFPCGWWTSCPSRPKVSLRSRRSPCCRANGSHPQGLRKGSPSKSSAGDQSCQIAHQTKRPVRGLTGRHLRRYAPGAGRGLPAPRWDGFWLASGGSVQARCLNPTACKYSMEDTPCNFSRKNP